MCVCVHVRMRVCVCLRACVCGVCSGRALQGFPAFNDFCKSDCPEVIDPFQGSLGLILTGHVIPPLPGVTISIQLNDADTLIASTDQGGVWRVGPVHGDKALSVQVVSAIQRGVAKAIQRGVAKAIQRGVAKAAGRLEWAGIKKVGVGRRGAKAGWAR